MTGEGSARPAAPGAARRPLRPGRRYPAAMPVRATKRGDERTPLRGDVDVLICGASFAGLAVARELAGTGARVLIVDRYEIGERQTCACAAPTDVAGAPGPRTPSHRPSASSSCTARGRTQRWPLPWTFSTFDYRAALRCCVSSPRATSRSRPRRSTGARRRIHRPHRPRRPQRAADRRRAGLAPRSSVPARRPAARRAPLARAWRSTRRRTAADDLELWLDPKYVRRGYSWSFPADDEVRVGVGSFDPRVHVKEPTVQLAEDLGVAAERYQGNWIPHQLRPATEDGVFFVGDSAGHCLPTTAEGIRTALLLRPRARARAARRRRGPPDARAGAGALRRLLRRRTAGSSAGCCACRTGSAGSRRRDC